MEKINNFFKKWTPMMAFFALLISIFSLWYTKDVSSTVNILSKEYSIASSTVNSKILNLQSNIINLASTTEYNFKQIKLYGGPTFSGTTNCTLNGNPNGKCFDFTYIYQ